MKGIVTGGVFPLTLTLSRREREQLLINFLKLVSSKAEAASCFAMNRRCEFVKGLEVNLPLPVGEGRGEGERSKYFQRA